MTTGKCPIAAKFVQFDTLPVGRTFEFWAATFPVKALLLVSLPSRLSG